MSDAPRGEPSDPESRVAELESEVAGLRARMADLEARAAQARWDLERAERSMGLFLRALRQVLGDRALEVQEALARVEALRRPPPDHRN